MSRQSEPRHIRHSVGDWRMYYFLFLLAFYLAFTKLSEFVLEKIMTRLTHGQGTLGGQV